MKWSEYTVYEPPPNAYSDDLYVSLRSSLLERARDKESSIRVQAALGIAKLQSGEDEDDLKEDQESLFQVLLDLLRYDPAASVSFIQVSHAHIMHSEVRRAALYNLPLTPTTLPLILARTRDIDPLLRRTVFHASLSAAVMPDPRVLSIAQREEIVRNGLGDRDAQVRKAAAGMLGGWVDGCEGDLLQVGRLALGQRKSLTTSVPGSIRCGILASC